MDSCMSDTPPTPRLSPSQLRFKIVVKNTFLQVEGRSASTDMSSMRRVCSDPEMYQAGECSGNGDELEALVGLQLGAAMGLTGFGDGDETETASTITEDPQEGYYKDLSPPMQTNHSGTATSSSSPPAKFNAKISQAIPFADKTEEDAACVVGGVGPEPHMAHLECENARLEKENMLLKQQCMSAASATQNVTKAAMAIRELPVQPSPVLQQAKVLGLQAKMPINKSPSLPQFTQPMHLQMAQMAMLASGALTNPHTPAGGQAMNLKSLQMAQMALLAGAMPQDVGYSSGLPHRSLPSQNSWPPTQGAMPPQAALTTAEQQPQQARLRGPPILPHTSPSQKGSNRQIGRRTTRNADDAVDARAVSRSTGLQTADPRTTVMIRNMPNQYTRNLLLDLIDTMGFAGLYDFLNLPVDFQTRSSMGYAFVNLVSNDVAKRFQLKFDGFSNWIIPSRKVCGVSWSSPHQGVQAHIERYRNSPVMHESVPDTYKPVLFKDGQRIPFPPPTRKLRAPKLCGSQPESQPESANSTRGGQCGQDSFVWRDD